MTVETGDDAPIEVHLPDGGHVIVSIEDRRARLSGACDPLIDTILHSDGSEQDLERALLDRAVELGLHGQGSATRHPTVVVIRS